MEEPIPNNDPGEMYVAEVQQNGKHIPLICTDVEEHKHLTNHFNKKLNAKNFDMCTYLFSNINVGSIQETYPEISVYHKVIAKYVEETNMKYWLNLKFTKLEALEVGLWMKTFQVVGHNEDRQLPKEQQLEPPKPQPPQQMTIPTSELPVTEQWVETGQMTSITTQWSHSTPVVLLIV